MKTSGKIVNITEKSYKTANGTVKTKIIVMVEVYLTNNVHTGLCILEQDEP